MFDVGSYTLGVTGIETYRHTQTPGREETAAMQKRIARKWNAVRHAMHKVTDLSQDEMGAWQLERISILVDNAFSSHPFYHQLYKSSGFRRGDIVTWEDYHALPTISKNDIIQNYDLFTTGLGPRSNECYSMRTSGSSGKALTTLMDPTWMDHEVLQYFRFYEQMLTRRRKPQEWAYWMYLTCPQVTSLEGSYPTFTVSNECPPELVLSHMRLLKPTIISGIAGSISRLASLVRDPNELGIKAITTNSEPSTKAERARIATLMGAPVHDEYSSVELSFIATECISGRYHIVEDNVRVDTLNPNADGVGEIVATNLVNTYMPFIRYRQGDIIKINQSGSECECGNRRRYLETFMGRSDQFLESKANGMVSPDQIMALYDRTLISSDSGIGEFQIIQTSLDNVDLFVVPQSKAENINSSSVREFVSGLKNIFGDRDLNVQLQIVQAIPPSRSHKRKLIENRIVPV